MQWNPAWVDICLLGSTRYSDCSLSFKIQCFITFNIRIFPHLVLLPYNLDELTYWFDITIPIVEIKLIPKLSCLRFMASGLVLSSTHVGVDRNPCSHFDLDFYFHGNGMIEESLFSSWRHHELFCLFLQNISSATIAKSYQVRSSRRRYVHFKMRPLFNVYR